MFGKKDAASPAVAPTAAEAGDELNGLAVREVLDADSRPTFVLDLDPDDNNCSDAVKDHAILPVFCNTSLRLHETLFDAIIGLGAHGITSAKENTTYEDFKRWVTGVTPHDDSKDVFPLAFLYGDMLWTGLTVRRRWRLISGNRLWRAEDGPSLDLSSGAPLEVATGGVEVEQAAETTLLGTIQPVQKTQPAADVGGAAVTPGTTVVATSTTLVSAEEEEAQPTKPYYFRRESGKSSNDTGGSAQSGSITLGAPEKAVADWTAPKPKGILSPHVQYAREVNWANTPLGPMKNWSPEFRQLANLCMVSFDELACSLTFY